MATSAVTDSGIEIKPLYTRRRPRRAGTPSEQLGEPGPVSLHPRHLPDDVPRPARGRCASTPASARPRRPTSGSSSCWPPGRPACRAPSTCRPRWATTPTTRGPRARSARSAWPSTRSTTCALLLDGMPLDKVTTSMTINSTAAILLLLYELVAEEQGVAVGQAQRHDPERHPEGVHRPRHLHLPAPASRCGSSPTSSPTAPSTSRSGTRSRSPATTSARPARRRCRRSPSPSPTASPTCRRPSTPASTSTSSPAASASSGTPTTTSSRRSPSSGPPGACGPGS